MLATRRERKRKDLREYQLETLMLASEGEQIEAPVTPKLRVAMADVAIQMLSNLVGEEREVLSEWLVRQGFNRDTRRWMSSRMPAERLRGTMLLLLIEGQ